MLIGMIFQHFMGFWLLWVRIAKLGMMKNCLERRQWLARLNYTRFGRGGSVVQSWKRLNTISCGSRK